MEIITIFFIYHKRKTKRKYVGDMKKIFFTFTCGQDICEMSDEDKYFGDLLNISNR